MLDWKQLLSSTARCPTVLRTKIVATLKSVKLLKFSWSLELPIIKLFIVFQIADSSETPCPISIRIYNCHM